MFEQLQLLLRQLSIAQRVMIAGGALGSAALLFAFVTWAGQPDYQPAFTRLTAADAGAVSEALRAHKIPFQLADAGTTILVPSKSLADARVAAGTEGVGAESGGDGFELFDKGGFGMSDFDQKVTYQRAIEGELGRTIESLQGVSSARVSIVPGETGLFTSQDRGATASVVVRMRDGRAPDAAMVQGIVGTVSGAVAGLTRENVTVVDDQGRILAGAGDATAAGTQAVQAGIERDLAARVQGMVDQALGPGRASVAVAATMDFDKVEQEIKTVLPGAPVSLFRRNESTDGSVNGAGGVPGGGSNIPGLPTYPGTLPSASGSPVPSGDPAPAGSPGVYVTQEETVNYDLSERVERITREPGVVTRLSVAVLIDRAVADGPITEQLREAISAAIGLDEARGDVVSVSAVPFAVAAPIPAGPEQMMGTATAIGGSIAGVLVALLLVFLVWRNMRALRRRAEAAAVLVESSRPRLADGYDASGASVVRELAPPKPDAESKLRELALEKPEALAGLMQGWLREEGAKR